MNIRRLVQEPHTTEVYNMHYFTAGNSIVSIYLPAGNRRSPTLYVLTIQWRYRLAKTVQDLKS